MKLFKVEIDGATVYVAAATLVACALYSQRAFSNVRSIELVGPLTVLEGDPSERAS